VSPEVVVVTASTLNGALRRRSAREGSSLSCSEPELSQHRARDLAPVNSHGMMHVSGEAARHKAATAPSYEETPVFYSSLSHCQVQPVPNAGYIVRGCVYSLTFSLEQFSVFYVNEACSLRAVKDATSAVFQQRPGGVCHS